MISAIFKRLFSTEPPPSRTTPPEQVRLAQPKRPAQRVGAPVYPATDAGIAYVPVDDVIATQDELLKRLYHLAGVGREDFERLYMAPIRNLAEHINLLPASEIGTHRGAGGLFRLCLEIAFFSRQASEGTIFSGGAGVERRRLLEPRWRYATWLAGLTVELHRPVAQMLVVSAEGEQWPPFQESLHAWLTRSNCDHYFVRWRQETPTMNKPGQGIASFMMHRIIPADCLQYLHMESPDIVPAMFDVATGNISPHQLSPMARVVGEVRRKVFERDEATRPQAYGNLTVGSHLEPHLLDAIRRLTADGTWKINCQKARLWYGTDGLFLVWRTAAKEMLELLKGDGITGMPQDPQTLLDLLLKAGVFSADKDGSPYWTIYSPLTSNELLAVKFANELTVLASLDEEPKRAGTLTAVPGQGKTVPASATPTQPANVDVDTGEVLPHADTSVPTPAADTEPPAPTTKKRGTSKKTKDKPDNDDVQQPQTDAAPANPDTAKPSKPVDRAPAPIDAAGERDVSVLVPEDLASFLTPLTRDIIGALLDDERAGKNKRLAGRVSDGFAISLNALSEYGGSPTSVVEEFEKLGWLFKPVEKPTKKLHQVQINGGNTVPAIILRPAIATDLGFLMP